MSAEKTTDVFGVGNAMVDILALVEEDFVREHDLPKGGMLLVDTEKQGGLLKALEGHALEMRSGGSAANTMIAIAQSGGNGFYSGKVARDTNGEFYRQDLLESGVHFDVHPASEEDNPTGTCLVLTTPDAERTMLTHLVFPRNSDHRILIPIGWQNANTVISKVICGIRPTRVKRVSRRWRSRRNIM